MSIMAGCPFYHLDLYRLNDPSELEDLGYEEYFYGDGVALVEWADRARELLPEERLDVYSDRLCRGDEDGRKLELSPGAKGTSAWLRS